MLTWSKSGCQVWVKNWRRRWRQCPHEPIVSKESVLLCGRHKLLKVTEGRAVY